jgi:hypothetical protein
MVFLGHGYGFSQVVIPYGLRYWPIGLVRPENCFAARSRFTSRTRPNYIIQIRDFGVKHTGSQDGNLAQVKV